MDDILNSPEVDDLATLVEEAARSTQEGVKRFVEPAKGTLTRAVSRRHHIVFGRRGSGKTSLLRKAAASLTLGRRPIAFVDLESFKGHSYPDVLISVLIVSFTRFKESLEAAAVHPTTRKSFRERLIVLLRGIGRDDVHPATRKSLREWLFGTTPKEGAFSREGTKKLSHRLAELVEELEKQLHLHDGAELQRTSRLGHESTAQREVGAGIGTPAGAQVKLGATGSESTSVGEEIQQTFRRSKIEFLRRHILEYQSIFKELAQLSDGDSFLFLDDLYHIRRDDQARLLDYFHRIAKGNSLWLKIGTIRHRSRWFVHGDPPTGLKLGDDADEIDLDLTLEQYSRTKDFLVRILEGLVEECCAPPISEFLAKGAVDRLVLASGGVARDFLGIFRRSIEEALERLQRDPRHYRGPKIGAEDVNLAAGKYGDLKHDEFKRDALEDQQALERTLRRIRAFCTEKANANCFLLDQDVSADEVEAIQELVDLRLVHLVGSRVTVSGRTRRAYKAYMLDVSQYTGSRKRRHLEMVEFWRTGSRERLRRASLIYDPSVQLEAEVT